MIEFFDVCKAFGPGKTAADHISLTVNDGEIFGFLGPNGAGKTTAISMMTGILAPDSGRIAVNGVDIVRDPVEAKRQFGYVPDSPDRLLRLTGMEYLTFMADVYDVPIGPRSSRIDALSQEFGIHDALGDEMQGYSHGMRQKAVIIGALLHDPAVWILDEPMTGLDPKSSYTLKQRMRQHARAGKTVFFSTHVLEVAQNLCDRVAILDHGRILFCGGLEELRDEHKGDSSLEKIFLEMTDHA
ncbi:MAG: ABC transporter ATP-binding protein [Bifidobacterium sp.]|jgi:ABC-2 type transport system ATP-binding protein